MRRLLASSAILSLSAVSVRFAAEPRSPGPIARFTLSCERVSNSGGRVSPYTITVDTAAMTVNSIPYTENGPLISWSTDEPNDEFALNRYTLDGKWVVHLRDDKKFDSGEMHC